jgi:hypothetical protein
MNPAYISALAALAGSVIGGLTSLATSWLAQRTQVRARELTRNRRGREELYRTFIDEASHLYIDALVHDESRAFEQAAALVKIYSVVSQMRILASQQVIEAAENIMRKIVDTYAAPNKTFPELREMLHHDAVDPWNSTVPKRPWPRAATVSNRHCQCSDALSRGRPAGASLFPGAWASSRDEEIQGSRRQSKLQLGSDPRTLSWPADKMHAFKEGLLNQIHPCATGAVQR